ncbi:MAG: hypothetical protein ACQESY_07450 [Pseudomonadota bacterium]
MPLHRKHTKVLIAITAPPPSPPQDKNGIAQTQRVRFLFNIEYMRENYEVTHNMKIGEDVKVNTVASNSGAWLMTTYHPAWMRDSDDGSTDCPMSPLAGKTSANPFRKLVERAQNYVRQVLSVPDGLANAGDQKGEQDRRRHLRAGWTHRRRGFPDGWVRIDRSVIGRIK